MPLSKPSGSSPESLTRINPAQLHEMRECFQVIDRDNDGQVTGQDVQEALTQIGQDPSSANMGSFFPRNSQPMNLSTYLNSLTAPLSQLSSPQELLAAFAAFDPDDSGQIDISTLREAILDAPSDHSTPALSGKELNLVLEGFTGRRAFAKGMGVDASSRGEVFRYTEFVQNLTGGSKNGTQSQG